eukprot:Seg1507.11 transcript_id=Seg1507.11/GoldUCD/mRNA.D3Y31 product="Fatty acid hydroxylase domain-containing protein 2" protein_id=Seg1507.11/GoldUCD/D3Y31
MALPGPVPDSELPDWAKARDKNETTSQGKLDLVDALKKTAFVLGTALVIFASARNSITWHFENFWGASKSFWEDRWNDVYLAFGKDRFLMGMFGGTVFPALVFWLFGGLFIFVDVTGRPAFLLKYKIQDDKNTPVEWEKLKKAIKVCLFNQFVVGSFFTVICYPLFKWRGVGVTPEELPTFQWVLLEIAVFTLVEEFGFYYSHRLAHHPRLYKHIHKIHHEWTAPISIVAIYAHPLEHVLSNLTPIALGPFLMGSHVATTWLWFALALMSTNISHSGYHFPFLPSPEAHDFHHLKFTNNFGVLGVLDRFHGTDDMFRKSKCYDRHIMLLGLIPLTQTYPDDPKKGECKKTD